MLSAGMAKVLIHQNHVQAVPPCFERSRQAGGAGADHEKLRPLRDVEGLARDRSGVR